MEGNRKGPDKSATDRTPNTGNKEDNNSRDNNIRANNSNILQKKNWACLIVRAAFMVMDMFMQEITADGNTGHEQSHSQKYTLNEYWEYLFHILKGIVNNVLASMFAN